MKQRKVARVGILQMISLFFAVFSVLAVMSVAASSAQSTSSKSTGLGNNLKISPLRTDVTLRPGESRAVSVYVENLESKPVTLRTIENDFVAGEDEAGDPLLILDENEFAPVHSLKQYMEPVGLITVQPGERKEVKVVIAVPGDATAGGYYGAVRFVPAKSDGSDIVNVSGSVASLITLKIPGDVTESMQLTGFEILQDGKIVSRLSSPDKVSVQLRMQNQGNVHLSPFGNLSVLKGDSVEPVYSVNVNDTKPVGLILPDSARKFDIPIKNLDSFGKYTFRLVLGYGSNNQTIEAEKVMWIVPSAYIVGGIVAATFLALLIVVVILALRAYKKRILRKARRR